MSHENAPCIFVVADNVVRHWLRFAFEVDGYRVCDCGSAGARRNEAPKGRPGYLVIDDTLPDVNGGAPSRRLRRARELPALMIARARPERFTRWRPRSASASSKSRSAVIRLLNTCELRRGLVSPAAAGSGAIY
jgi:DNA-binding response OmpR family regulator